MELDQSGERQSAKTLKNGINALIFAKAQGLNTHLVQCSVWCDDRCRTTPSVVVSPSQRKECRDLLVNGSWPGASRGTY